MLYYQLVSLLAIVVSATPEYHGCGPCCRSSSSSSSCSSSSSSSCSSSSSSSELVCCDDTLLNYDFNIVQPLIGQDWQYYNFDDGDINYTADDGQLSFSCAGASLHSMPFTAWMLPSSQPQLDHFKYWLETVNPVLVNENDTVTAEWKLSVQTFRLDESPYYPEVAQEDDVRMAYGGVTARDPDLGLLFGFALTNDRIYGLYQRSLPDPVNPTLKQAIEDPIGFTYVIPLKHRKSCDIHKVKLVFAEGEKSVAWWVDGHQKFKLAQTVGQTIFQENQLLVQLNSGANVPTYPFKLIFGFGTFTALDWYPACKDANCAGCRFPELRIGLLRLGDEDARPACSPISGCQVPAEYYYDNGIQEYTHIWGQGVDMQLGLFKVRRYACF